MTIENALNTLRADVENCSLVGFVDTDSELVLAKSSALPVRQERLDGMAAAATTLFAGAGSASDHALLSFGDRLVVFVRDMENPGEVCFCECSRSVSPKEVVDASRVTLTTIQAVE